MPWGAAALARASAEDKPLLVSIGYSACHWCHVMERESFEDERTAALMNESFVCVKVDREERPDVDALYMEAVQGMTGQGGWPLNVFLTPQQIPFYGGTYFPPEARPGMPSWTQVLQAIAASWTENREEIQSAGERIRGQLSGAARLKPSDAPLVADALDRAVQTLSDAFDERYGGFGGAPKFPQAPVIEFLIARAGASGESRAGEMALRTLRAMAAGGIHDQLAGGFHRYSVDRTWTVPHFEKMLYDNALLARAYLHGWALDGERALLDVSLGALAWVMEEMQGAEGGFHAALDADSEGAEGRFYVWTAAEIERELGADAPVAMRWLGVTEEGNFTDPHEPVGGLNVLTDRAGDGDEPPDRAERKRIRSSLLAARARRARPGLDDKRLTSWNALMITALAEAASALQQRAPDDVDAGLSERMLAAAVRCAEFILSSLRDGDGRLLRTYNHGEARIGAYLEDHAFLLEAMLALFEATCDERWLEQAVALADQMIARFADDERGGFFSTPADGEALLTRRKEIEDLPIPSGASSAAVGLLRLAELTSEQAYEARAVSVLRLIIDIAPRHPGSFAHGLLALHHHLSPMRPISCPVPARLRSGRSAQMIDR
jgi:uncharacterized protein YyaL (SSP411 family)